ncbi:kinase-like protein [Byssothecium circinans]|uniref:Kinase-like protein n=1 Tax=Byssothecium circinans TaxID=147558 RepID=A0A6A5TAT6_9PLEO|nr:kinase-like protein [Byssothecium circinans]
MEDEAQSEMTTVALEHKSHPQDSERERTELASNDSRVTPTIQIANQHNSKLSASQSNQDRSSGSPYTLTKSGASSFVVDGGDAKQLNSALSRPEDSPLNASHDPQAEGTLEDALREARIRSIDNPGSYFIPVDQLDNIITKQRVLSELQSLKIGNPEDRESYADKIWKTYPSPESTTRRKIFATLVLTGKVETILDFIEENVHDVDLPFYFPKDGTCVRCRNGNIIESFHKSNVWRARDKDSFDQYQWFMLSPYFELSCDRIPKVRKYAVEDRAVLPFIDESSPTKEQPYLVEGGFSIVKKVKLHAAHYNSEDFPADQHFAIKTLNHQPNIDHPRNQEVESLIRLNNKRHKHLIRLLVTFQQKHVLHLVFPWASGNLAQFWMEAYPDPQSPPRNHELAQWMAGQCLGLALGLKAIQDNPTQEPHAESHGKNHGRHGDLKPENVLWFQPPDSEAKRNHIGDLKISDFGMVDFHKTDTRSAVPLDKLGMTPTYRAPEWDVKRQVSQSYDLWCMGCVLLEFVEWYLKGKEGVEDFITKRVVDSITVIPTFQEDNFFNSNSQSTPPVNLPDLKQKAIGAIGKESVRREIHELRHHERSSDFILDLLDFIEEHLLRMNPKKRAKCNGLVEKLSTIHKRCTIDLRYCTDRRQMIREKRTTSLSELWNVFSPQLKNRPFGISEDSLPSPPQASGEHTSGAVPASSGEGLRIQNAPGNPTQDPLEPREANEGSHSADNSTSELAPTTELPHDRPPGRNDTEQVRSKRQSDPNTSGAPASAKRTPASTSFMQRVQYLFRSMFSCFGGRQWMQKRLRRSTGE